MPIGLFLGIDEYNDNVMLRRVRDFDWASTSVGRIEDWPEDLRSVCRAVLLSSMPTSVLLGPDGLVFHNDAVLEAFGPKASAALGQPIADVLPNAGHFCRKILGKTFAGKPTSFRDFPIRIEREGGMEKAWFDLDFTPISDPHGQVHGVLVTSIDRTSRVAALHDLRVSREKLDIALASGGIVGTWEIDFATETVRSDARFARLHGIDPEVARVGSHRDHFLSAIHPDDMERVMAAFDQAKIDGRYNCQHRVIGSEGTRWIIASGHIRRGSDGVPQSFMGTAVDITAQVETAAALTASEKRFRTYTETLPHIVFSTDKDGQPTYINRRWSELTGRPKGAAAMRDWEALVHPEDRALAIAAWQKSLAAGTRHDLASRYRDALGAYRWMRVVAVPIRDDDGRITSWIGTLTDIHEARMVAAERELVSKELDHRIKNFFAVAQGLVSLTRRETQSVEAFADQLGGRLATLHRSYELIRSEEIGPGLRRGQSLLGLIRTLLTPYAVETRAGHISIAGDDIMIDSGKITPFALVLHELATNAAKYGALSLPDGEIHIDVARSNDLLRIVWRETGVPVSNIASSGGGFGSRLLERVIEGQLRGRFSRVVEADGLRLLIEVPLETL